MKSRRRGQSSNTSLFRLCAVGAAIAAVATASSANADDSAYCRRVRARASSDAALLIAPTLRAEALKLPSSLAAGGRLDATPGGSNYQIRAGGSVSLINIYKGTRLSVIADADCAQHAATTAAQELVLQAQTFGRVNGLRAEASFLEAHRAEWEAIATQMAARLAAQNVTLPNVEDVLARTTSLARRRTVVSGEIARIEASGLDTQKPNVAALAQNVDSTTMRYEREASHVRAFDSWDFTVTGGYVPPVFDSKQSDFFGVVQVSYSIGGAFRNAAESRYLEARSDELKTSRSEVQTQLHSFRQQIKADLTAAKGELTIVETRVAALQATRTQLEGSDASGAPYALAMVDLELVAMRAEQVFLAAFARELTHVEEN